METTVQIKALSSPENSGAHRNWHRIVGIAVFILIISLPAISGLYLENDIKVLERRKPASAPGFPERVSDIGKFPGRMDKFLEDRVGFRDHMVFSNGWTRYQLGAPAPRNQVLLGEQGFVFRLSSNIGAQYLGARRYRRAKTLNMLFENIVVVEKLAQQLDAEFFLSIAPNKITVYGSTYGPDWYNSAIATKNTQIQQFKNRAQKQFDRSYIDLLRSLRKNRMIGPLYSHYGTHWDELGAFITYREIMQNLAKSGQDLKILDFSEVVVTRADTIDDTVNSRVMGLSGYLKNHYAYVRPREQHAKKIKAVRPAGNTSGRERLNHYFSNKSCEKCPRLVVIGDSFSLRWHKLFPESFSEVLFVHHQLGKFDTGAIRKFNPDFIFLEMVEQQLSRTFQKPRL